MWGREEPQRSVVGATLEVMNGAAVSGTMEPRMNFYPMSQAPVPTPAVRSALAGDLYVNLQAFRPDGSNATIRVIYEPLVPWIWAGGGVVVFGALIAIFPHGEAKRSMNWKRATIAAALRGAADHSVRLRAHARPAGHPVATPGTRRPRPSRSRYSRPGSRR